jgi:hypothetical protein
MSSLADKFVSGLVRLAPFGKQADDPLATPKAATRWLESLPVGDAFRCQQAILGELRRFNENSTALTKDRLAVLMLLDEKSRDLQDTLAHQYLRNPRMSRPAENQLWHAVYGLYWEIARGYHAAVLQFAREAGKNTQQELFPLLTLRAIRTFGQLLKWRAIRYLPAGNHLWQHLHKLYRAAESAGFHRLPQRAYAEETSECSCETAYLHILMLNLADSGTLYPRQIDLIDHWLCGWHRMLQLDDEPDSAVHNFSVDLSADHGPRRLRKSESDKPLRFWATAALVQKLDELHTALREGQLPAQLGLTEAVRPAESVDLLEHLQRQWSSLSSREQRRAPRESTKRLVDVAHGLSAIIDQVKTAESHASESPYGTGLSYEETDDMLVYGFVTERTLERTAHTRLPSCTDATDVECWVMHDESEFGYGAIVESGDKDWLRVGALIGLKSHDGGEWKIGIVRRLSRLSETTCSVGIETLAEPPVLATLYDTTQPGYTVNGFDNSGSSQPRASLWLAGSSMDSVMVDPIHYTPGKVFEIQGVAERTAISFGHPIERSEGWVRVAAEPVGG